MTTRADSFETAFVVDASDTMAGVKAEYQFIGEQCGVKNQDWKMNQQNLVNENEKYYDVMEIELASGEKRTFYFDITEFFGK